MPYDSGNSDNFISESFSISDYSSGNFDFTDLSGGDGLLLSGDQLSGESNSSSEVGEDSQYDTDYSDLLGSIDSYCSLSLEQIESLSVQLDNLNTNVCILNENIKFGIGLLFTLTFLLFLKFIYNIFIKVLGLGKA